MSLSSQTKTQNDKRYMVIVLPHQMELVKNLITCEVTSDCEYELGTGYLYYRDVVEDMSYTTWRHCLQWLEENEELYVDYEMEGYPYDSSNCQSVWINHNGSFEVIE